MHYCTYCLLDTTFQCCWIIGTVALNKLVHYCYYMNMSIIYISTKLKLYNTCILPIFLYGSECWAFTKRDVDKIDALDQWCLHKLLGIKWCHHVRNDDVRWKTEQPHLSATVQARRLSLFGRIAWMPDESDAKQILTASPWRTGGDHQDAPILRG